MQSIFRQLPKLCSSLMCAGASSTLESLPRSSTLTLLESLPRRGKREFATLQLWNSDEGLEGGTAHLDIKHLVKNWRMDNTGGYSSSQLRERLRGFQGENIKETDIVANTFINSYSNLCTFCAGIILFLLCDHIVVNFCRFNCPIQRLFMKYRTSHSSVHFCPTIMVNWSFSAMQPCWTIGRGGGAIASPIHFYFSSESSGNYPKSRLTYLRNIEQQQNPFPGGQSPNVQLLFSLHWANISTPNCL